MERLVLNERTKDWLSRPSCSVPQLAEMFGLSRNATYEAIERGDFKAIRIGKRIVVPTAPLRKMLLVEDERSAA